MFEKDRYEILKERFPDLEAYIESRYVAPDAVDAVFMAAAPPPDMCYAAAVSEPKKKKLSFPLLGSKRSERSGAGGRQEKQRYSEAECCEEEYAAEEDLCGESVSEPVTAAGSNASVIAGIPTLSEDEIMKRLSETWQESLLRMIDERGFSDTEVYKRANIDRKLFSKIRGNASYQPKKITAVAFVLALRLDLDDAKDMLAKAGFAFSPSSRFDLIVEYFIEHEVYDLYTINLALFEHKETLIGA